MQRLGSGRQYDTSNFVWNFLPARSLRADASTCTISWGLGLMPRNKHRARTYDSWKDMCRRTTNPKVHNYYRYGGRGIKVCSRWRLFENFLADMGFRPAGYTLDRVDNDKDYSPENCVWATPKQQANNTRRNKWMTKDGETKTLQAWANELGIDRRTIQSRLRYGWSEQRALSVPVDPQRRVRLVGGWD